MKSLVHNSGSKTTESSSTDFSCTILEVGLISRETISHGHEKTSSAILSNATTVIYLSLFLQWSALSMPKTKDTHSLTKMRLPSTYETVQGAVEVYQNVRSV